MAWGLSVLLVSTFQCSPIDKAWYPRLPGHCINPQTFFWGNAISNLFLDVLILMLAVFPVWKSSMARRQKIIVTGVFALGVL